MPAPTGLRAERSGNWVTAECDDYDAATSYEWRAEDAAGVLVTGTNVTSEDPVVNLAVGAVPVTLKCRAMVGATPSDYAALPLGGLRASTMSAAGASPIAFT